MGIDVSNISQGPYMKDEGKAAPAFSSEEMKFGANYTRAASFNKLKHQSGACSFCHQQLVRPDGKGASLRRRVLRQAEVLEPAPAMRGLARRCNGPGWHTDACGNELWQPTPSAWVCA
eukprot:482755-Amphidinium_carterae.1